MKKLRKLLKHPRIAICAVLSISIISVSLFLYVNRTTDIDKMNMTYSQVFDTDILKQNITTSFKQTYQLKDYTTYGENLMLYENEYTSDSTDNLQGKNVLLKNVLTNKEFIFTFSGGVDSGIDLSLLDEGLYEIYVYDHYKQKRVYFSEEIESEKFTTMRRNSTVKSITLNTNRDYLKDLDIKFEKNYAFLTVMDNTPISSIYDVVLDPCGNTIDIATNSVDYGYSSELISEAQSSYELACLIKDELEKAGLRVLITRDEDEDLSYYGSNGRVGKGYEAKAKVFISLGMTADDTIVYPYFVTSPYTNGLLANEIAYYMKGNNINLTPVSTETRLQEGVCFDVIYEGEQGNTYTQWEVYPQIRESGGKSTFAGSLSNAIENQMYAKSYGMYGLYFTYANINLDESIDYYVNHKESIAKNFAKGFLQFFRIENETE